MSVSKRLDAGSTEQRSLIVEAEGCISVKPVRFRMRLGREHVLFVVYRGTPVSNKRLVSA